uniref:Uncharacterized protein n=1 Tax=Myoviridae sp. ctWaE18 TaxID=2826662 RepID=A0A8S5MXY8_9CAUD|nr:MAG TPA: hypothetical protein [Myoviridae sp. ctWaE18]
MIYIWILKIEWRGFLQGNFRIHQIQFLIYDD